MSKYYLYITLFIALVSCSDNKSNQTWNTQTAIILNCGVSEYSATESRTNPTDDNSTNRVSFNIGDEISLNCFDPALEERDDYRTYVLTSSGWSTSEDEFEWEKTEMRFVGYYPTTATSTTFETPQDQSSAEKIASADLMRVDMVAEQTDDNSVELLFARQMAYVEVSVSKYGDIYEPEENYITNVKIYDYVEDQDGVVTISPIIPYERSSGVYSALIKGTSGIGSPPEYNLITFTDAKGNEYYVPNTTYLQPRYKHTISLLVGGDRTGITIESIDVEPWSEIIFIEGGDFDITEIDPDQCIDFSDNDLKSALVQQHNYTLPSGVNAECIDTNGNGEIEFDEAAAATQVVIGVDYDPENYNDLYTYFSHITEFRHLKEIGTMKGDIDLTYFPSLKILNLLATTSRSSYDFSGCPYLQELYLFATHTTNTIDLRTNRYISDLKLNVEGLQNIDLSNNIALTQLTITDTPLLDIDLSTNTLLTTLSVESSDITQLDLSNNTKIKSITLESNDNLSTLNMNGLEDLTYLYCNVASIPNIDLSQLLDLRTLYWGYTNLESISVINNTNLTSLTIEEPKITTLDISNNTKLTDFLSRYTEYLIISESQSSSPGVIYWLSRISVNGTVVVE